MTTSQKLFAYKSALEVWRRKKFAFDANAEKGLVNKKPLEREPMPDSFLLPRDDIYAKQIRIQVLGIKPKYPVRKV